MEFTAKWSSSAWSSSSRVSGARPATRARARIPRRRESGAAAPSSCLRRAFPPASDGATRARMLLSNRNLDPPPDGAWLAHVRAPTRELVAGERECDADAADCCSAAAGPLASGAGRHRDVRC